MLQTVRHEAKRVGFRMPAPERMWKVSLKLQKDIILLHCIGEKVHGKN